MFEYKNDTKKGNQSLFEYISSPEYNYDNKSFDCSINSSFCQINKDIINIGEENAKRLISFSELSNSLSNCHSFTKENSLNIMQIDSSNNLPYSVIDDNQLNFLSEPKYKSKIEIKIENLGREKDKTINLGIEKENILYKVSDSKNISNLKESEDFDIRSSINNFVIFKSSIPKYLDSESKNEIENEIEIENKNILYSFSESENNNLNSVSELITKSVIFKVINRKTKRGRKTNNFKPIYSHTALDTDNGISKIQVHFINYIIDLSNDALITEFGKNNIYNFKKPAHYLKKNANYEYVKKLQSGFIRNVLEMDISQKYLKYKKNHNKEILKAICSEWFEYFININCLKLFKDYYYNNGNPLDEIIINGKTINLSIKTKSFYFLVLEYKSYKDNLEEFARIYLNYN